MRATIQVIGDANSIDALVGLALTEHILVGLQIEDLPVPVPEPDDVWNGPLAPGTRVRARARSTKYGVERNDCGVIQSIIRAGFYRRAYTVRWDDNTESDVAAHLLEKIHR